MSLKTEHLTLAPYTADQLLAPVEPKRFAGVAGYPAADGLRGLFVPSVLAKCGFEFVSDVIDPGGWTRLGWQRWPHHP